jgi:hypothetical protein
MSRDLLNTVQYVIINTALGSEFIRNHVVVLSAGTALTSVAIRTAYSRKPLQITNAGNN